MIQEINVEEFKIDMKDIDPDVTDPASQYDLVQPKFDGWWTILKIENSICSVITSGGKLKHKFETSLTDCTLLCEWIYGTNWAQSRPELGMFVIFDMLSLHSTDIRRLPYSARMLRVPPITDSKFLETQTFPSENWREVWGKFVEQQGYEGLVFKSSSDPFSPKANQARLKKTATMNYIVIGFKEGTRRLEGTLGALIGGLVINGKIEQVCTVGGGFTDQERDEIWINKEFYIGNVFEATGKILFTSGALRHPAFSKWRKDVSQQECTLRRQ